MTTRSGDNPRRHNPRGKRREQFRRYWPAWLMLGTVLVMLLPALLGMALDLGGRALRAAPGLAEDGANLLLDLGQDGVTLLVDGGGAALGFLVGAAADAGEAAGDLIAGVGDWLNGEAKPAPEPGIAPLFTPEVARWQDDILRWADAYDLDPNLIATLMQIESCGHPTVSSPAGAQGLFQVMPFHFASGEDPLNPDTNARRSAGVLHDCLARAGGDAALAMACYNGGPSVIYRTPANWLDEPRRFYYWGSGIYTDARHGAAQSARLDEWLAAGGARLCALSAAVQKPS